MQNVKIIFFADTHLGFDFPIRPKLNTRRRGPDFFDNYNRILSYAEKSQPDFIIHGGDFFFRSKVPQSIIDLGYKPLFDFVNKTNIPAYIVPGNHERSSLPQSIYLAHPLINIFYNPCFYLFEIKQIKVSLHGFPFVRGNVRKQFKNLLKQSAWSMNQADLQLLIMHQAVDGARVGPRNFTFRNREDVIDISEIPADANAVLSGHIHRKQIIYAGNVPFIYPGSIERTSFAERDEQKGFYEIIFSKNKTWAISQIKFLRLYARPMYDIFLSSKMTTAEICNLLIKQCKGIPTDSIVRLKKREFGGNGTNICMHSIRKVLPPTFNVQLSSEFYRTTGK